ncbi:MAG: recombinase RecQ [Bdellovibrionales bacterium GWA2_49_15]|nr:MAG: recombinase RecQ [Bdellovibrionales bacterium GWA2_49_15]HAZ11154.1 recombinase RecQ [Bdellovibrionales bacterium]
MHQNDRTSLDLALEFRLTNFLQKNFGLQQFRKGQLAILESIIHRRDALAVMPTGGGKSLCYQLPSLFLEGLVVVVSPLIALMKDQVRGLQNLNMRAGAFYSGQTLDEKREIFEEMKKGGPFVLYLSPERVQNPGFQEWVKKQNVVLFAIDEAHCVSQWGPDFREDYHKLQILRELCPNVPILALTATATPPVLKDMVAQLLLKKPDRHVHGFYRPNLFYQVEICPSDEMKYKILCQALRDVPEGRVLIYCGTRKLCQELTRSLKKEFKGVGYYHAGLDMEKRQEIQAKLEGGKLRILAATNAFGMGIDYPNVRLVVHYQMPANIESFYQEMGRAGRDGQPSRCLLLYSKKDKGLQSYFITQSTASDFVIQRRWESLNAMIQFAEGGECRHAGILTYFKDSERIESCGHCDSCMPDSDMVVTVKSDAPRVKAVTKKTKKKSSKMIEGLDEQSEVRLLLLKDWRRQYAREKDIPAFIVFSDRTLHELATKNPTSLLELYEIYGFGPAKVELFGRDVLGELGHRQYGAAGAASDGCP